MYYVLSLMPRRALAGVRLYTYTFFSDASGAAFIQLLKGHALYFTQNLCNTYFVLSCLYHFIYRIFSRLEYYVYSILSLRS